MSKIDQSLLSEFLVEAREHIEEMEGLLLKLEQGTIDENILNDIFRTVHSIKGGAQYLGLNKTSQLTHQFEDFLELLREGKKEPTQTIIDLFIEGQDRLVKLLNDLENHQEEQSSVDDLLSRFTQLAGHDGEYVEGKNTTGDGDSSFDTLPPIHETTDIELFNVFIENLTEKYSLLRKISGELSFASERSKLYEECTGYLENLVSSSRYMAYEKLTDFFELWLDDISKAPEQGKIAETLINDRLDWLLVQFPQLDAAHSEIKSGGSDKVMNAVSDAFNTEDEPDNKNDEFFDVTSAVAEEDSSDENIEEQENVENIDYTLLQSFLVESSEHLESMEALLLKLGSASDKTDVLDSIFRSIHTIKGGSQYVGLRKIAMLSHRMEDLFDLLRVGKKDTTVTIIDLLIEGKDKLSILINELENNQKEISQVSDLVERLTREIDGDEETLSETKTESSINSSTKDYLVNQKTGVINIANINEDYDQELFEIFWQHLKEQLVEIVSADTLSTTKRLDNYMQCVSKLQSSANYMGYEDLSQFYDDWLAEIREAKTDGENASLNFIDHYTGLLINTFPQLADTIAENEKVRKIGTTDTEQEVSLNGNNQDSDITAQEDDGVEEEDLLAEKLSQALDNNSKGQQKAEAGKEDFLVEKLSQALENSTNELSGEGHQSLHDVFDEVLSTGKGEEKRNDIRNKIQPFIGGKTGEIKEDKQKTGAEVIKQKRSVARQSESRRTTEPNADSEKIVKKSLRVDAQKIDTLMNQVGELVVDRSYFFQLFNEMRNLQIYLKANTNINAKDLKQIRGFQFKLGEAIASLNRTSNELQEGVMKVRMLPIAQLFNRYPRLVHDLTRKCNKKVKLMVEGESTELDKMIVEELSDPLIHIIRNAIDHGIETVDERMAAGKAEEATLTLKAYQESNHIVIEIHDDGRGINTKRIKEKALEKGLYSIDELDKMSEKELIWIIMSAGFSTSRQVTDTSGRGVGMDVVRKNIEKLNGILEVETKSGIETQVRLKIPLTLAIISALQVSVGSNLFTIPLANVEETLIINDEDSSIIEDTEVIKLRGHTLPIFRLSKLFNVTSALRSSNKLFVVVVSSGMQKIGLVVDELKGKSDVVIKPLVDYLQEKSGFSGATIIGDGRISLILDIYDLTNITVGNQHKKQQARFQKIKNKM